MTLNEYQTEAMRTASRTATAHEDNLLLNGVMGLNGEAGEAIDMVKKMLFKVIRLIKTIWQKNWAIAFGI